LVTLGTADWRVRANGVQIGLTFDTLRCSFFLLLARIFAALSNSWTGHVCLNRTCASACSLKQMHQCNCPSEDDNYCYLCCGSATQSCQPAHLYGILKPNGETWERDTCRRCRHMPNGMPCDDKSQRRVCVNERCTGNVCRNRSEGRYCDLLNSRLCVDGDCRDPCGDHWSQLVTCECDTLANRCELCCFDFRTKQCESAFRKYGIGNRNGRPIIRIGLSCNRNHHLCNRYGKCAATVPKNSKILLKAISHRCEFEIVWS
uniref:Disintegrin domain-containing protein n=1 Tax=Soboliphyme baturini TaxID=241478 RepID=A0A183IB36_9BILA